MKDYSLKYRAELYNSAFPQYAKYAWLQASDSWLWGIWSIGNNYKGSGYHGCLHPDTLVLNADLNWVSNGSLKKGDFLVGVDEYPTKELCNTITGRRTLRLSEVINIGEVNLPSYRIITNNGKNIVCSGDHLWLTAMYKGQLRWKRVDQLSTGDRIRSVGDVWQSTDLYESGYVAGLLDGEGSMDSHGSGLRFAFHQNKGAVADTYISILNKWGIELTIIDKRSCDCLEIRTKSIYDTLKLLSIAKPIKHKTSWVGKGLPRQKDCLFDIVEEIIPVGNTALVGMDTSTKTFIAEGLVSHNSYPPSYLKRVMSMFPDAESILHLFSGSLDENIRGERLDINPALNPDIVGDAHKLGEIANEIGSYDLIVADPPYTESDADKYGTPMVNRNKVVKECHKILEPGGYLIWLDMVLPLYRKDDWNRCISIGIERSTNHRFRQLIGWRKPY